MLVTHLNGGCVANETVGMLKSEETQPSLGIDPRTLGFTAHNLVSISNEPYRR
jgi:hypothetical protein